MFYSDFMKKEANSNANSNANCTQLYRTHSVLNADCIYLTVYQLLSLNLQLRRGNCYQDITTAPPISKVNFIYLMN